MVGTMGMGMSYLPLVEGGKGVGGVHPPLVTSPGAYDDGDDDKFSGGGDWQGGGVPSGGDWQGGGGGGGSSPRGFVEELDDIADLDDQEDPIPATYTEQKPPIPLQHSHTPRCRPAPANNPCLAKRKKPPYLRFLKVFVVVCKLPKLKENKDNREDNYNGEPAGLWAPQPQWIARYLHYLNVFRHHDSLKAYKLPNKNGE